MGHNQGVDWWALGVLLYEMIVGVAPFCFDPVTKKPNADLPPTELYKNILNPRYELAFPSRLSSAVCSLIEMLLAWDPLTRIGRLTNGAEGVRSHVFYDAINWDELLDRSMKPPFMPELKDNQDTSHFDEAMDAMGFLQEPEYDYAANDWDRHF